MTSDQEYDGPHPGEVIPYLLELLDGATSQMERDNYCSELILLSQYMDDAERTAFAAAVRRVGKPRSSGRPSLQRRHDAILFKLCLSPEFGGYLDVRRVDVVKEIADYYGLTAAAADKAYAKALKAREKELEDARNEEKSGKTSH
jgi:hypothetical protein